MALVVILILQQAQRQRRQQVEQQQLPQPLHVMLVSFVATKHRENTTEFIGMFDLDCYLISILFWLLFLVVKVVKVFSNEPFAKI